MLLRAKWDRQKRALAFKITYSWRHQRKKKRKSLFVKNFRKKTIDQWHPALGMHSYPTTFWVPVLWWCTWVDFWLTMTFPIPWSLSQRSPATLFALVQMWSINFSKKTDKKKQGRGSFLSRVTKKTASTSEEKIDETIKCFGTLLSRIRARKR